ncbi:MAG: NAD-dependent epimerase/dehydratase family protein, partial [Elusimicrobia bacterium]|nr:NAD-dependent epimerase/dehydratase family protein [Elusimicrobiota bacterium]
FNVYGPREDHKGAAASMIYQLCRQMVQGRRPRIFKYGEQSRDFVYVKDVIAANLRGLEVRQGGLVNIATGQPTTFNRIIDLLNESLGTSLAPDYFDNPYSFYQEKTVADLRSAKTLLNYRPEYSIEDGIRDYWGQKLHAVSA